MQEDNGIEDDFEEDIEEGFAKLLAEVRHCKYCETRLTHVIRGLPQEGDEGLEHEFLEFWGGCIIEPTDEDWYCKFCGAKEGNELSPESGACFLALPTELQRALKVLTGRFQLLVPEEEAFLQPDSIRLECALMLIDSKEADEHLHLGDFVEIDVCQSIKLKFYLEGNALSEVQSIDDSQPPYVEERNERFFFEHDTFKDLKGKVEDFAFGNIAFSEVARKILEESKRCDGYLCNHEEKRSWELLFKHLESQNIQPLTTKEWLKKNQDQDPEDFELN